MIMVSTQRFLIIDNISKLEEEKNFVSEGIRVRKPSSVPENNGLSVKRSLVLSL